MTLPQTRALAAREKDGVLYYAFPALEAFGFVRHGISTRLGGVSGGVFESMNLSFTRGDEESRVRENFHRFCGAIGVRAEDVVVSAQTHGTTVYNATRADRGRGVTRERGYTAIDGLVTDEPDVVLCTQYADCVPLFFVDPVRRVVGTAHAGWRGTVAGIGAVMVEKMAADYGCAREEIRCGIGPSIGPCCFEVDEPVYRAFAELPVFDSGCGTVDGGGKYHVDLWEVNRRILVGAGIRPEHVTVTDLCTRCRPDVFWSHRATGGERGSLACMIALHE